ncbi:hypothetical protein ElyMa_005092700 [Elysia marginata]|uniref:Uncharacterized protein n=1 Tax=Elysia marginata TaxID=1093978 RepID=A0AAV4JK82_9GAST|nr:hypothetical protein ElyMa_005092700 [Elysia marginata]
MNIYYAIEKSVSKGCVRGRHFISSRQGRGECDAKTRSKEKKQIMKMWQREEGNCKRRFKPEDEDEEGEEEEEEEEKKRGRRRRKEGRTEERMELLEEKGREI